MDEVFQSLGAVGLLRADGMGAGLLGNALLTLFVVVTLGLLLGRLQIAGVSFGSSGVIFIALTFGHFGFRIPDGIGTLGLLLFVYSVGLSAGPRFFRVFVRQGKTLAQLGTALVVLAVMTTWGIASMFQVPDDLAVGLFAGAMTSTPALAAAIESLPAESQVAVGYGIAYPFGVISIVLFVQLVPRLLRQDFDALGRALGSRSDPEQAISRVLVEVINPAVIGRRLPELEFLAEANCQVSRLLQGSRLVPVPPDLTLEAGHHLLVVGQASRLSAIAHFFGRRSAKTDYFLDTERERMRVVVSSKNVAGHSLGELKLRNRFGVTVSRILRHGLEFVPAAPDEIEYGDALTVVGEPENLARFATFAGHRARTFDETDLISLGIGMSTGIIVGMVSFDLAGYRFALGMAGGPLFVALILAHFGRIGPVIGHLPRASQLLLMETGLVFFLAQAGIEAGGALVPVVEQYGLALCIAALTIAFTPMLFGYVLGRYVLGLNLLQILGGVCGGMTSTPGLGAIAAKTESEIPVLSYAAAYPVALILMTVGAQVLVGILP